MHIFDYCVRYASGFAEAIAVKPEEKVGRRTRDGRASLQEIVDFINAQGVLAGYAHRAVVQTRSHVPHDEADNARLLRRFRRYRHEDDVREALDAATHLGDRFRFADLLAGATVRSRRRAAVWNLIDDGVLVPEERGRVRDRSWLRMAAGKEVA